MYLQDVKKIIKKLFFSASNRSVRRWCVAALEVHVLPLQQLPLTSTHLNTFGRGAGPDGQTTGRALWTPTHTHTHTHTHAHAQRHTHTRKITWPHGYIIDSWEHAHMHVYTQSCMHTVPSPAHLSKLTEGPGADKRRT